MESVRYFLLQSILLLSLLPLAVNATVVLQYHHIDDNTSVSTSTSIELFKKHLEYLSKENYEVVPLPAIILKIQNNEPLNENTVAITFDDGYESIYRNAFPLLKAYGMPFTIFIDTAAIEEKRRNHISWEQVGEMRLSGATIANHTHNHSHLIRHLESFDTWKERVSNEIIKAQEIIKKRINQDLKILAYPYGEFCTDTIKLVSDLGYVAFGQHSGAIDKNSNLQHLPRFPASNRFGQFPQLITKLQSIAFKNLRFEPKYGLLTSDKPNPPVLSIKGDRENLHAINCYGPDGELTKSKNDDGVVFFKASQAVTTRRFRYNCTAKVEGENKFMWVSVPWINPAIDE